MIPVLIYEALPVLYTVIGWLLMLLAEQPLILFSANIFYFVGATIWILRSAHRRTDHIKTVHKAWLWPDLIYEYKPFLQILTGVVILRIPSGAVTIAGCLLILIAFRHLLQRHANRKCSSNLFA